jgi:replicative DNA helicase
MSRIDAEAAVLGACLIDGQAYWKIADLIRPDDFSRADYRELWTIIAELVKANVGADFVTVGERNPKLTDLAIELSGSTPSSANVRGYAEWVVQASTERRVQSAGQMIAKLRGADALGEAQRILGSCAPQSSSAVKPVREYLRESIGRLQQRVDADDSLTGVPTGVAKLDEMTAGLQRGDLVILAARPSVGKTAFAMQWALHAAESGHAVLFMSLEMTGSQLADRALSHLGHVSSVSIREPKRMDDADWTRITNAGAILDKLPLLIDDSSRPPIETVEARIRQVNASRRLGLVVIDYLGLMKMPRAEKKTDAVGELTGRLKAIAKDLQIPVVVLCQLNRGAADARPSLDSLRDSGDIEQDADVVAFLWRPQADDRELIQCDVAKQRNGPTGDFHLHARMDVMRFDARDWTPPAPAPSRGFARYGRKAADG